MPANYVLLEKITVGAAGAASVTFNSIPQTGYTDLVVKCSPRQTSSSVNYATLKLNGSSANFTYRSIEGSGSTAGSFNGSTAPFAVVTTSGYTANTFSNIEFYIPNYTSSNYKSYSSDSTTENNATQSYTDLIAGLWSNTAAITSIELTPGAGNFAEYSTFYLYGVAALGTTPVIVPYATGGDTIMTDGTYWYHAFLASGTFTPAKGLSCDVLVVAGGGGQSAANGYAGAGAGGVFYATAQSLASGTGYTATVGAGGSSSNGSNSTFASLTAAVGGGRGGAANATGSSGGSGGGGGANTGVGGSATQTSTGGTGYGNAGGNATSGFAQGGGGGGAGGAASGITPGIGTTAFSSWGLITGTGVNNSGTVSYGKGGYNGNGGTPPVANTGGGGGWDSAGGSGVVIVRYAV